MDVEKEKRVDFTILENKVIRDVNKFDKNELLAYTVLNFYADTNGNCNPSYETLAKYMRTSRRTAITAVQGLVEKGIIKLQNQKEDKKKEMNSNLYTLVSVSKWEDTVVENRKYLIEKTKVYKSRLNKSKITKESNKKAPNSIAVESDANVVKTHINKNLVTDSIPQSSVKSTEFICENIQKNDSINVNLLKESGITYVPFNKESDLIESLDTEILSEAILVTREKAGIPNWRYLLNTYDSIYFKQIKNSNTENNYYQPCNYKGGFGMCSSFVGDIDTSTLPMEALDDIVHEKNAANFN